PDHDVHDGHPHNESCASGSGALAPARSSDVRPQLHLGRFRGTSLVTEPSPYYVRTKKMANGFYSVDRGCHVVRPWRRDGRRQLMGTRQLAIAVAERSTQQFDKLAKRNHFLGASGRVCNFHSFAFRCAAASLVHSTNLQAAYNRR